MYVVLFIILDFLIVALLLVAIYFIFKRIQKKHEEGNPYIENDLDEFRNETLHEQAKKELNKLAHIEEVAACRNSPKTAQGEEDN